MNMTSNLIHNGSSLDPSSMNETCLGNLLNRMEEARLALLIEYPFYTSIPIEEINSTGLLATIYRPVLKHPLPHVHTAHTIVSLFT